MKICNRCHLSYKNLVNICPFKACEHSQLLSLEEANKIIKFACHNCGLEQGQNEAKICLRCNRQEIVPMCIVMHGSYMWREFIVEPWKSMNDKYEAILKKAKETGVFPESIRL